MQQFRFCPQCSGDLRVFQRHENIVDGYVCSVCGFEFWQNSKPTASAILVNEKGRILLAKRGIEPYKDYWDLPGGYLQNGEDPLTGLRRELREELHVEVDVIEQIGIYMDRYGEGGDFTINIFYLARVKSGEIMPGDDVVDYSWFALAEIPDKIAFVCIRQVLDDFIRAQR